MYIKNKVDSLFRSTLLGATSYDPSANCIYCIVQDSARGQRAPHESFPHILAAEGLIACHPEVDLGLGPGLGGGEVGLVLG